MRAVGSGVWFSHAFGSLTARAANSCLLLSLFPVDGCQVRLGGQFEEPVPTCQSLRERKEGSQFLMATLPQVRIPGAGAGGRLRKD